MGQLSNLPDELAVEWAAHHRTSAKQREEFGGLADDPSRDDVKDILGKRQHRRVDHQIGRITKGAVLTELRQDPSQHLDREQSVAIGTGVNRVTDFFGVTEPGTG